MYSCVKKVDLDPFLNCENTALTDFVSCENTALTGFASCEMKREYIVE